MITEHKTYQVRCDVCHMKHPHTFNRMPDEDDLNDWNDEFGFGISMDGSWELHTHTALSTPQCYCHSYKRGVWCPDCAAKFWNEEDKKHKQEMETVYGANS